MALGQQAEQERQGGAVPNVDFGEVLREQPVQGDHRPEASSGRNIKAMVALRISTFKSDRANTIRGFLFPCVFLVLAFWLPAQGGGSSQSYAISLYPSLAFGVSSLGACITAISHRERKIKHVIQAQGVSAKDYWIGSILAELCKMEVLVFVFLVMYFIYPPQGVGNGPLPMIVLMAVIHPVNVLLFSLNVSSIFETAEVALKILPLMFMLLGMVPCAIVWVLIMFVRTNLAINIANAVHIVFSLINPLYSIEACLFLSAKSTMAALSAALH